MTSRGSSQARIEGGQVAPGFDSDIEYTAVGQREARFSAQSGQPPGLLIIALGCCQAQAVEGTANLLEQAVLGRAHGRFGNRHRMRDQGPGDRTASDHSDGIGVVCIARIHQCDEHAGIEHHRTRQGVTRSQSARRRSRYPGG